MRNFLLIVSLIIILVSCNENKITRIETFQQINTYWDQMLLDDMKREASTVSDLAFKFNVANDTEEQISQIKKAVRSGADAIVVNPYDGKSLIPVIEEAYDAGVYVILVGQKIPTFKYHAYSGIDNVQLGRKAATYVCNQVKGEGNLILVQAFTDAPYYKERFESFKHVIENNPEINIVGTVEGQWDNDLTHKLMDSLKRDLCNTRVDLVYSFGSMVIGAIESSAFPNAIFVGTDGVPGECLEAVKDGSLQATFFNPTGGREAMKAAICLTKGLEIEKDNIIQPTLVTSENALMIDRMIDVLRNYEQKIDILRDDVSNKNQTINKSSLFLIISLCISLLMASLTVLLSIRINKDKNSISELRSLSEKLEKEFNDVFIQKELAQKMNSEMVLERESLIKAGLSAKENELRDVISEAIFMKRFRELAEKNIENSDYSVDNFAKELGVSRAQLFRKIKNESGSSPNDLFQSMRLEKARQLLIDGKMNVAEVSYAVGFTSPSYFSKCYKDRFGEVPSDTSNSEQ